jgi:hypothetical protein
MAAHRLASWDGTGVLVVQAHERPFNFNRQTAERKGELLLFGVIPVKRES